MRKFFAWALCLVLFLTGCGTPSAEVSEATEAAGIPVEALMLSMPNQKNEYVLLTLSGNVQPYFFTTVEDFEFAEETFQGLAVTAKVDPETQAITDIQKSANPMTLEIFLQNFRENAHVYDYEALTLEPSLHKLEPICVEAQITTMTPSPQDPTRLELVLMFPGDGEPKIGIGIHQTEMPMFQPGQTVKLYGICLDPLPVHLAEERTDFLPQIAIFTMEPVEP